MRWCQISCLIEGFHLLFHESGLAPLFHPLSASFSQKNHFFGVFQVCPGVSLCWSEYAPRTAFQVGKKILLHLLKEKRCNRFCDLFRWGIFTHFHSARLKTHYILSGGVRGWSGGSKLPPHLRMIMWYKINDNLSFILCDFITQNTIFLFSVLLLKGFLSACLGPTGVIKN